MKTKAMIYEGNTLYKTIWIDGRLSPRSFIYEATHFWRTNLTICTIITKLRGIIYTIKLDIPNKIGTVTCKESYILNHIVNYNEKRKGA